MDILGSSLSMNLPFVDCVDVHAIPGARPVIPALTSIASYPAFLGDCRLHIGGNVFTCWAGVFLRRH